MLYNEKQLFLNLISTSKYVFANCHSFYSTSLIYWVGNLVFQCKKYERAFTPAEHFNFGKCYF